MRLVVGYLKGSNMPGAWEVANNNSVLCAILHTDVTTVGWAFGLRNLQIPGSILPLAGMPYDMARNVACQEALKNGFTYVFMYDSDVIAPRDAVLRLMSHNKPIVSGLYCRRSPPAGVPVMIRNGQWVTNFPKRSLIEVDMVGAGCLLIHRSVLEKLPHNSRPGKPWFDWQVDMAGHVPEGEAVSEDFRFCQRARQMGEKIYVDTSIVCKHVGYAEAEVGTFGPHNASPVT